jgi:nucleoside triphosphate pyrophosphatase
VSALILASSSAVRARMLAAAGVEAIIDPAAIDEARIKAESQAAGRDAGDCALFLAEAKAKDVARRHHGARVLGADQMLECEGRWFDKPRDLGEARAQLQALSGRNHRLITAAAVVRDGALLWRALECPVLTMRRVSAAFLDRYLAAMGKRVLTTVGGYELEGLGAQLMTRIEGDYFAILGLPILPLLAFLREDGALAA